MNSADDIAGFYAARPYPHKSMTFTRLSDDGAHEAWLRQEISDDAATRLGGGIERIWVAGCGTNQAALTALKFPGSAVVGTDVSAPSLEICSETARSLGIENLTLEGGSIEEAAYCQVFDYVVCTGVLHHLSDPLRALRALEQAVKPGGVVEVMVYGRAHRNAHRAFRTLVEALSGEDRVGGPSLLAGDARQVAEWLPPSTTVGAALRSRSPWGVAGGWEDEWANPFERDYTFEEFVALVHAGGLQLDAPCVSPFDRRERWCWELPSGGEVGEVYWSLRDEERWRLAALARGANAPMLWFYLRKGGEPRTTEADRTASFLRGSYKMYSASATYERLRSPGELPVTTKGRPFPAGEAPPEVRDIWLAADGSRCMNDIITSLGRPCNPYAVYRYRTQLCTSQFPFLVRTAAVSPDQGASSLVPGLGSP